MSELTRFGVSMDSVLLEQFDQLVVREGYNNRSEAFRDLVKKRLIEAGYETDEKEVAATITLIYPYGTRIKSVPKHHHASLDILANLQVHLDKQTCLKVIVLRGKASEVAAWAQNLLGMKGVLGQFTVSAAEDVEGVW